MVDRDHGLRKITEIIPESSTLTSEQLVLSYQSRVHFQEAITVAATTKGSDKINALVGVARSMAEAGVAPTAVLKRLAAIRNGILTNGNENSDEARGRRFTEFGMAGVHGMLGTLDSIPDFMEQPEKDDPLWYIDPLIYSAQHAIRQEEDPAPILEAVMDRIARNNPRYNNHYGKTAGYVKVSRVFYQAKLDPDIALSRAETEVINARDGGRLDPRAVVELASGYTSVGNYTQSLRMIDYLESIEDDESEIYGKRYAKEILESVISEQTSGSFDETLEIAKRFGWDNLAAWVLAKKAVALARQGQDISSAVLEANAIMRVNENLGFAFEKVYPQVGLALALSVDAASNPEIDNPFKKIMTSLKEMDVVDTLDAGFALAEAVDEAGYDATEIYREAFAVAEEFRIEEPGIDDFFGVSLSILDDGIRSTSKRGYFDLAREYLDKYPEDGWSKSMLLCELAKEEAKRGLSQEQIEALTPMELRAIALDDAEMTQQALAYFNLQV